MMFMRSSLTAICLSMLTFTSCKAQEVPVALGDLGVTVDHHMHLRTEEERELLIIMNDSIPEQYRDPSFDSDMPLYYAVDIVNLLDEAGLETGVILSGAYFAGMPEIAEQVEDPHALTIQLNNQAVAEARQFPNRLKIFCSINPLSDFALEEISRCADNLHADGLKLHIANSGVDLRDQSHLESLYNVFNLANNKNMPIVIHLRSRNPEFGSEDVMNFVEHVLFRTPTIELYLAHYGSWGGVDPGLLNALETWANLFETTELGTMNINFDIAAAVNSSANELYEPLAELTERIGAERFHFGSDWPAFYHPNRAGRSYNTQMLLAEDTIQTILTNRADYIDR